MATTYQDAPDVEKIAEELIRKHHPRLEPAVIEYVFRDPPATSNGATVQGKARAVTGLNAYLSEHGRPFLVIEIAQEPWGYLDDDQRAALVDHELMHCGWDEAEERPLLRPHDVEEFAAVVARHGLWSRALKSFVEAGQLALKLEE